MKRTYEVFGRAAVDGLEAKFWAAVYWLKVYRRELKCWRVVVENVTNPVLREFAERKIVVLGELYTRWRMEAMNTLHLLKELKEAEKDASCGVS